MPAGWCFAFDLEWRLDDSLDRPRISGSIADLMGWCQYVNRPEAPGEPGGAGGRTECHRYSLGGAEVVGRERRIRLAEELQVEVEFGRIRFFGKGYFRDVTDFVSEFGFGKYLAEIVQPD